MRADLWTYTPGGAPPGDLTGFVVEARDGSIGRVDEATDETGRAHLVVDTSDWIARRTVVIPAGTIERIDDGNRLVFVDLTKDQIENAPELDGSRLDDEHRNSLETYYARFAA